MKIIIQIDRDEYIAYKKMAVECGWGDDTDTMIKKNLMDDIDLIYDADIQIVEPINSVIKNILRTL